MDEIAFIKRQAERKNMTPREYCIYKIDEWKENLREVSTDYRYLDFESFEKKMEEDR